MKKPLQVVMEHLATLTPLTDREKEISRLLLDAAYRELQMIAPDKYKVVGAKVTS